MEAEFLKDGAYGEPGPVLIINAHRNWIENFVDRIQQSEFCISGICTNPDGFHFSIIPSTNSDIVLSNNKLAVKISRNEIGPLVEKLRSVMGSPHSFNFFDINNDKNIEIVVRHCD